MLLGWVIEIITRNLEWKNLFYKKYKDVLTELYC